MEGESTLDVAGERDPGNDGGEATDVAGVSRRRTWQIEAILDMAGLVDLGRGRAEAT